MDYKLLIIFKRTRTSQAERILGRRSNRVPRAGREVVVLGVVIAEEAGLLVAVPCAGAVGPIPAHPPINTCVFTGAFPYNP